MTPIFFKRRAIRISAALAVALPCLLAACGKSTAPGSQFNPHPKVHFLVEGSLQGAPGPFDTLEAKATYDIANISCVPLEPLSGARKVPSKSIVLPLTRQGASFRTTVTADALADGDYFGEGICHWRLVAVSVQATRKYRQFQASISPTGERAEKRSVSYFSAESYRNADDELIDTGLGDPSGFRHPETAFRISLTARKATNEP